jgi:hypothetical protein
MLYAERSVTDPFEFPRGLKPLILLSLSARLKQRPFKTWLHLTEIQTMATSNEIQNMHLLRISLAEKVSTGELRGL